MLAQPGRDPEKQQASMSSQAKTLRVPENLPNKKGGLWTHLLSGAR